MSFFASAGNSTQGNKLRSFMGSRADFDLSEFKKFWLRELSNSSESVTANILKQMIQSRTPVEMTADAILQQYKGQ